MKLRLFLLIFLLADPMQAGIRRYSYHVKDSSANPSAHQPEFIIADTEAECPSTDAADGDLCYASDVNAMKVRANGQWTSLGGGPGGGAPTDGEYVTHASNAALSAERVLSGGTNTAIDLGTAGQAQVDISGQIAPTNGGTGDDTSAASGVCRVNAGDWLYDAGIGHLAASTSASLRGVLSDEVGTGAAMFGIDENMADDMTSCTGSQVLRRNSGDTAWECATVSGGSPTVAQIPICQGGQGGASVCFTFTNKTAAYVEVASNTTRQWLDLSPYTQFRIAAWMGAAAVTADLLIECDTSSTFASPSSLGTLDNPPANGSVGAWIAIPANECATADGVWIRMGMLNGNGTEDPSARTVSLFLR